MYLKNDKGIAPSSCCGALPDNDLRKDIVAFYTMAKGLIDSFRLNNDFLQKLEYAEGLYNETENTRHKQKVQVQLTLMINYAKEIKKHNSLLKEKANSLLHKLRKHGVLSEKHS